VRRRWEKRGGGEVTRDGRGGDGRRGLAFISCK